MVNALARVYGEASTLNWLYRYYTPCYHITRWSRIRTAMKVRNFISIYFFSYNNIVNMNKIHKNRHLPKYTRTRICLNYTRLREVGSFLNILVENVVRYS